MKKYKGRYGLENVNAVISDLVKEGYDIETIPGCLLDNYIMIPPTSGHYCFAFLETYLNEWSSCYTVVRYTPREFSTGHVDRLCEKLYQEYAMN